MLANDLISGNLMLNQLQTSINVDAFATTSWQPAVTLTSDIQNVTRSSTRASGYSKIAQEHPEIWCSQDLTSMASCDLNL